MQTRRRRFRLVVPWWQPRSTFGSRALSRAVVVTQESWRGSSSSSLTDCVAPLPLQSALIVVPPPRCLQLCSQVLSVGEPPAPGPPAARLAARISVRGRFVGSRSPRAHGRSRCGPGGLLCSQMSLSPSPSTGRTDLLSTLFLPLSQMRSTTMTERRKIRGD
jgi:hypothetical protein